MSSRVVMIGVVKLFERESGRGVIAPKDPSVPEGIKDLYFATDTPDQFREGQLVKFVRDDSSSRALDVAVLSEKY